MRSRVRARQGCHFRNAFALAACCLAAAPGAAPSQAVAADEKPRSTLRIGAPQAGGTAEPAPATAPTGGARFVIRPTAPPVTSAPLSRPPAVGGASQLIISSPNSAAPAAGSPTSSAPTSSGAAAYTVSNEPLPPIVGFAPGPAGSNNSPAGAAPLTGARIITAPSHPASNPAPAIVGPAGAPAANAMTPARSSAPYTTNPPGAISIAGDGSLNDGIETPATSAPAELPADAPSTTAPGALPGPAIKPAPSQRVTPTFDKSLPPIQSLPPGSTTTPVSAVETFVPETLPADAPGAVLDDSALLDPTKISPLTLEPVDFNGVLLGETTLEEVIQAWGKPLARSGGEADARLKYQIDPFAGVDVTFVGGKAAAVVVDLGDLFTPDDVAQELNLHLSDSTPVEDPEGRTLGLLFPERGVSFRYEDGTPEPRVAHIGLDRIDARPFVMRAEKRRLELPSAALIDLATALDLDPKNSRAHWLKSRILSAAGRPREALASAEAALKFDPKAAEYLLARAGLLAEQGLFEAALKDNETVLNGTQKLPNFQARAWRQRGDFLADGPQRDLPQAIDAHTRAVRVAETLFEDPKVAVRRDAKQTLIDAHLGIAEDIAWGDWQSKDEATTKWLTKAEALAKEAILDDGLSPYVILRVYAEGLAACVGARGAVEPLEWAEKLHRGAEAALKDCTDPLKRRQIQFEAGLGLYDALQALHAAGDVDNALRFGILSVNLIQAGRAGRDEAPTDNYRFGRLYFRIGSLYAVAKQDHKQAVEWFNRAAPLLERPLSEAAAADRGRQGETLVSMGISYWAVGNRERAMRLTDVGTEYMQTAVRDGLLEPSALGVAYSNLAVMHRSLGDEAASRKFTEMAARAEPTTTLQQGGTLRR